MGNFDTDDYIPEYLSEVLVTKPDASFYNKDEPIDVKIKRLQENAGLTFELNT